MGSHSSCSFVLHRGHRGGHRSSHRSSHMGSCRSLRAVRVTLPSISRVGIKTRIQAILDDSRSMIWVLNPCCSSSSSRGVVRPRPPQQPPLRCPSLPPAGWLDAQVEGRERAQWRHQALDAADGGAQLGDRGAGQQHHLGASKGGRPCRCCRRSCSSCSSSCCSCHSCYSCRLCYSCRCCCSCRSRRHSLHGCFSARARWRGPLYGCHVRQPGVEGVEARQL